MSSTPTRCRNCNALNGDELFCRACDAYLLYDDEADTWVDGAPADAAPTGETPAAPTRCPRPACGAENPPGAVFCLTCDAFLPWEPVLTRTRTGRASPSPDGPERAGPPNADHEPDPGGEAVPTPDAVLPGPPIAVGGPIEWAPRDTGAHEGRRACGACGEASPPTRWFCARCGEPLRATPAAQAIARRAATAEVARPPWWRRWFGRRDAAPTPPAPPARTMPGPAPIPNGPAPPSDGDRTLRDVDRSKGAMAVAEALSPTIEVQPLPPGPLDTVRAGLGRGRPGRIGLGFVAKLVGGLAALALVVVLVEQVREPFARRLSYEMALRGIRPHGIYQPLVPGNAFGSSIAPGRSGRYAVDAQATTYWADDPADPNHRFHRYPWIDLDFRRVGRAVMTDATATKPAGAGAEPTAGESVTVDQIGLAIGIQNGDFPYRANPRPRRIKVVYGEGCRPGADVSDPRVTYLPLPPKGVPLPADCRIEEIELADKPGFQRFRIPRMTTVHVTVHVVDVYQDVTAASNPARAPQGWIAITDVTVFELLSFEDYDTRERQARSDASSNSS